MESVSDELERSVDMLRECVRIWDRGSAHVT